MLARTKDFVKSLLAARHQRQRADELRASRRLIPKSELRSGLEALGIARGDTLMLHSSLKSIGFVDGGPRAVLEALVEAVGPSGTLVVPTYWLPGGTILATCKLNDYVFDPRRHGSHLGRLPSEFLTFPGIARSIHPTHSVSAIGRDAHHVVDSHHLAPSIFGEGSPWDRCEQMNAKVIGLGISMGPVTFYHLLEDRMLDRFPLPVRMDTTYSMPCLNWEGRRLLVPVVPLDPQFMPQRIDAPGRDDLRAYFRSEFDRNGLLGWGQVGEATSWVIPAQRFYAHLQSLIGDGITIYATPEQLAARPL
ncbi:MAG: AAC(3) family N-acetyltransferase [Burkholderiaceae bacterium]